MPRFVRVVPRHPGAPVSENRLHVPCALGHALAGRRLISDELLAVLRRITSEDTQ
jgi:hypothetical protein